MNSQSSSLFPIAITLFYYDQRIWFEGFDIELKMDAAAMNARVAETDLLAVAEEPEERPA